MQCVLFVHFQDTQTAVKHMGQEGSSLNNPTSSSPTITDKHAEISRTRKKQGILESPIINNQTTDNDDDECKEKFHSNMKNYKKSRTIQVYVLPTYTYIYIILFLNFFFLCRIKSGFILITVVEHLEK